MCISDQSIVLIYDVSNIDSGESDLGVIVEYDSAGESDRGVDDDTKSAYATNSDTNNQYIPDGLVSTDEEYDDELDKLELYDDINIDDIYNVTYLSNNIDMDDVEEAIFSPVEMLKLKEREVVLIDQNMSGYYRYKIRHAKLYQDLTEAFAPFIEKKRLEELQHKWSTHKNEGLNTSIASYAPKNKHCCGTSSLDNRVYIVGSVQVLGYYCLWSRIFRAFDIDIDPALESHWRRGDNEK